MQIALKEACETEYWLERLTETKEIGAKEGESILADCREWERLLHATEKTAKRNLSE